MADDHMFLMGDEPFFYINTGTNAVPVYVAVDLAEEVSLDLSKGTAEFKPRSVKHTLKRGAKHESPLQFKYPVTSVADTVRDALFDSFVNGTPIEFAVTDKAIADSSAFGFKAYMEVMKFPMPLNAEEGFMIDVEAEPTDYVEGGALIAPSYIEPS